MTLDRLPDQTTLWLSGHFSRRAAAYSPGTQRTYRAAMKRLSEFLGEPDSYAALGRLMAMSQANAHATVLAWRAHLTAAKLSSSTINLCLAMTRSAFKAAYTAGVCPFILTVPGIAHEPRRDRRGPPWASVVKMLAAETGTRNRAFLAILAHRGLRMQETLSLEREHVGEGCRSLSVLGKGRKERIQITLEAPTAEILGAWIAERGDAPGRIFPIGATMASRIIERAGRRVGIEDLSAHRLRHSFGTRCAKMSNGDVSLVASLLRHKDWKSSSYYVDDVAERADEVLRRAIGG